MLVSRTRDSPHELAFLSLIALGPYWFLTMDPRAFEKLFPPVLCFSCAPLRALTIEALNDPCSPITSGLLSQPFWPHLLQASAHSDNPALATIKSSMSAHEQCGLNLNGIEESHD